MILLLTDVGKTVGYGKYAGTYKIATELRKNGYHTQVVDHMRYLGINRLKKVFDKFITKDTLFVGVSTTLLTGFGEKSIWGIPEEHMIELVKYAKSINPNVKFVAGGAQITLVSCWDYIDYVVVNKGDNAILAIADHLKNRTDLIGKKTANTFVVNGDDYFYTQEEFAESKIIFEDHDIITSKEALPIEVARGCIFKCSYCFFDLIGKRIGDWTKTEDALVEELTYNYNKFGVTAYMVTDELINESLEKVKMMVRVAKRLPFNFSYTAYARIDLIYRYPEMIDLLLESGAVGLAFGIETFHPVAGKAVGKGMDANKVKETLKKCKAAWKDKCLLSSNFIIGLPGEPKESILETIEYLESDDCPIDTFEINLLEIKPTENGKLGNKMGDDPAKYGYELAEKTWVSNLMDKQQAREFYNSLLERPYIKNKRKFSSATYIGRIISLGFTIEEIFEMLNNQSFVETTTKIRVLGNLMKQEYYERLMKL
jgi:radical SAM superfamily enzyme YgiQ (UPF0313 family)